MKCAHPDGRVAREPFNPAAHFVGRLVGESQGENLVAGDSLLEQPGNAVGDDASLAASRSGQDQQGALQVRYGLALGIGESTEHGCSIRGLAPGCDSLCQGLRHVPSDRLLTS